jgi:urate oxidase
VYGSREIEELGLTLARQIVERQPKISRARVEIAEQRWQRLEAGGRQQAQAFVAGTDERRLAIITTNGQQTSVVAGLAGLTIMRTAGFTSGTAPADTDVLDGQQPLLVGTLSARWTYTSDVTFGVSRQGIRAAVLDTFAWHPSQSVHHALYAVADVVLSTYTEIADVTLAFHERPYRPADLFAAGTENPNELFVVVDEPVGVVEVTVERSAHV